MNKNCLFPALCRLIPTTVLLSFLIYGCAGLPNENRHDNTVRQYSVGKNENSITYNNTQDGQRYTVGKNANATVYTNRKEVNRYTIGQHDMATAYYNYRKGNRPAGQPVRQASSSSQYGSSGPNTDDLKMVLDITDILFEFDKWVIKEAFYPELDKWVEFFNNNPEVTAEIYGHADSTGPTDYNQKLSERRAQAVVNYLVEKGVEIERLTARGFGESLPIAPNTTPEGRQQNRRVEFNVD